MSEKMSGREMLLAGPMFLLRMMIELAKRLGFGKQLVALAFKRMFSGKSDGKAFAGYQPSEHDVFVATFTKSGTNWMMQIAQQITHRGESEFEHIHDVVPWPDAPVFGLVPLADPSARERAPTGLRVIKTHLASQFVPYNEKATYLTVLRDPKEVVVSSYHFLGGMIGLLSHVTIDDWFEAFVRPGSMAGAWAKHTASYWDWRNRPNVLVLGFGEMGNEPRPAIERVAEIMGVALTEAQLTKVIERSDFKYMQAHESQFKPPKLSFAKESNRPLMVRRGTSGKSDELLSRAQQAEIDRTCHAELVRLGSDFPYSTAFHAVADHSG